MAKLKGRTLLIAGVGCLAGLLTNGCSKSENAAVPDPAHQPAADAAKPALPAPVKPHHTAQPVTLAEGTPVKVRLTTALSTKTQETGETFAASLAEPIVEGGRVIAPKGARVDGRVVESDPGGRVKGRAKLAIALTRIHTAEGHAVEVHTNTVAREAQATKGRDAAKIGIGSGIGAAIGAIAGGGKGAAIGAATGAGAGAGVVLATHGAPATFASESLVSFKLRSAVTVPVRN